MRLPYGRLDDGTEVERCELRAPGLRVSVLTYGGIIERVEVPDRLGHVANVVLGMPTLEGYVRKSPFFGAILGRYANRIAGGRFTLDGRICQIAPNDGANALHGGAVNWSHLAWQVAFHDGRRLVLSLDSADGESGFPGRVRAQVTYSVEPGALRLDYEAEADAPTVVNLSNHSYWNLAGEGSGATLDHVLTIPADHYLPTDPSQIPLGDKRPVEGTPFDFRHPTPIGERIRLDDPQLAIGLGYDHCWVLASRAPGALHAAAHALDPHSGRALEVLTDQPGLQFYSGNRLDGSLVGIGGRAYRQGDGFALETQHFPDSPNHPGFPSTTLRPGSVFKTSTVLRFSAADSS